jgi:hypothetical protein
VAFYAALSNVSNFDGDFSDSSLQLFGSLLPPVHTGSLFAHGFKQTYPDSYIISTRTSRCRELRGLRVLRLGNTETSRAYHKQLLVYMFYPVGKVSHLSRWINIRASKYIIIRLQFIK